MAFAAGVTDREDRPVVLFRSRWELEHAGRKHPELRLAPTPDPEAGGA